MASREAFEVVKGVLCLKICTVIQVLFASIEDLRPRSSRAVSS